jgi:hypothetical protein
MSDATKPAPAGAAGVGLRDAPKPATGASGVDLATRAALSARAAASAAPRAPRTAPWALFVMHEAALLALALGLCVVFVLADRSLAEIAAFVRGRFVATYVPLRAALGGALWLARAGVRAAADGGAGEEAAVAGAAAALYVALAHALPGVDAAATVRDALGGKAAALARGLARGANYEVSRVLYFACGILAVRVCAQLLLPARSGARK